MKRTIDDPFRYLRRLIAVSVILVLAPASATSAADESSAVGVVVGRSGIVTVLRAAMPGMVMAGDRVHRGDRIVTGPGGRLGVAFEDGATVSIGPRTDIIFSHFVTTDGGFVAEGVLELVRGVVRNGLPPSSARARFEIRTPTATVSARTADLIVEATDTGSAVFVVSGQATASGIGTGERVVLEPDFGTDVALGTPPGAPKRWDKERVGRVLQLTGLP